MARRTPNAITVCLFVLIIVSLFVALTSPWPLLIWPLLLILVFAMWIIEEDSHRQEQVAQQQ